MTRAPNKLLLLCSQLYYEVKDGDAVLQNKCGDQTKTEEKYKLLQITFGLVEFALIPETMRLQKI